MSARPPDTHAEAWALLPFLANGRLAAGEREWLEAHVGTCAECRAELDAQRAISAGMRREDDALAPVGDEQKSFDKLWARIEASESAAPVTSIGTATPARSSRTVRWLAAAVIVQAIGLGVLAVGSWPGPRGADEFVTVTSEDARAPRPHAPSVRLVFSPGASIDTVNTLLAHQGLEIVSGPGSSGHYTATLSQDAVAAGASADSVAAVLRKDPHVSFAEPVAR
jgi:hypothetical protein